MEFQYDAIVIGAGPGGTTIAGLLAAAKKKILVIDKNPAAGGRMMSLHQLGHTYEPFPLNLMPNGPSLFEELAERTGKTDKINNVAAAFQGIDKPTIIYRDHKGNLVPVDIGDPKTALKAKMSLKDIIRMKNVLPFIKKSLAMTEPELAKLEHISAIEYMKQQKLPEIFFVFITASMGEGAFEMSSDKVPASHMIRMMKLTMGKEHTINRYYEGGVGGFFDTILETVEENGGKCLMNTRVKQILVEDGKAVGVETEAGDRYYAPIVISNAGIRQTVLKLVGESCFPADYAERVKELHSNLADIGYRYFTTKPVLEKSTYVYFPWNCLEPWSAFEDMAAGKKKPTSNYIYIGTKSVFPTVSPEGKQLIYAVMSCHPDPNQNVKPYLDYIEDRMKELFPALYEEGVIEKKEVMTLQDVSKYGTDSILPGQGGESYGIANSIGQSDGAMPTCKTPVQGLYIVGNDAEGFGVGTHRAVDSGFKLYNHLMKN